MCGICGIIKKNQIAESDSKQIRKMCDVMAHRGPDDEGFFQSDHVALGHRRLSIIDPSPLGHQPMNYLDRYTIVFNGEIYNYLELKTELKSNGYCFNTNSDTEVILAAYDCWKEQAFNKFNGMWAMAIYDSLSDTTVISRDRFGVKPLYYYFDDNHFVFASEIKAIVIDESFHRKANDNIVYDYLCRGLVDHTYETFFEGVFQFPRASYAIIKSNDFTFTPQYYWDLYFNTKIDGKATKEECIKFRELFINSIKLRLRSDVPVGSCLSGGLDSSAIVCAIDDLKASKNHKQHTFSYRADDEKLDEYRYMDAVIRETNVEADFVSPKANDLFKEIDDLIYHQDEPFSTTGMYAGYCVYREAKQRNVVVLLDGQGADELLCGYRKSRIYYLRRLLSQHKYLLAAKEFALSVYQIHSSLSTKSGLRSDIKKILRVVSGNNKANNIASEYLNDNFLNSASGYGYEINKDFQYNDVFAISLPPLLRYTDRNSMAFSVESRLPFLDYQFAEYCANLSISKKLENGYSKAIMRKSVRLPRIIRDRKDKIGFATPEDKWIKSLGPQIKKTFLNNDFKSGRFVNKDRILKDWDSIVAGDRMPYFFRIFCLEKWMQIFDVE